MRVLFAVMCTLGPASFLGARVAHGQGAPRVAPGTSSDDSWGEKQPPEGFVKSKEPKKSESTYNWLQMGYAAIIMLGMGGFIVFLVKRNTLPATEADSSDAKPGA